MSGGMVVGLAAAVAAMRKKDKDQLIEKCRYILECGKPVEVNAVRALVNAVYSAIWTREKKNGGPAATERLR